MDVGLVLSLAGDVMWIAALSVMAGAARTAWRRVPKGVSVPMLWDDKRVVIWRAPRVIGLTLLIAIGLVGGLLLLWLARNAGDLQSQVIWFGVRALVAPLLALAHIAHLKRAVLTLGAEGRLVP